MQFLQRRSVQPDSGRRTRVLLEALESRTLLSRTPIPAYLSAYVPSDLRVTNPITGERELVTAGQLSPNTLTSNSGKIVSGTDREGDSWTITVHGPGKVIVTDTTPNDGKLDDDIATIQIVGSNINSTYVTGNITASPIPQGNLVDSTEGQSDEKILFNRLIANTGVRSINLNGFVLTPFVSPSVAQPAGIQLNGGVRELSFDSIAAFNDTASYSTTQPINISIGQATNPLPASIQPSIYLNNITNLVYDSSSTIIPTTPITTPNVSFQVNGTVREFSIVSTSQGAIPGAYQFLYPVVGTTGRTSLQAHAVNGLDVTGSAVNFTTSRSAEPFTNGASGLAYLRRARFGGNADALALDVNGNINSLSFRRGLGNPAGVATGVDSSGHLLPATNYGLNEGSTGYPASGYQGGLVRARSIRRLELNAANVNQQPPQNPNFDQLQGPQTATYIVHPGMALTSAAVTTSRSIGNARLIGSAVNSEIKTGFDYASYAAGLEGTRAASQIRRLNMGGSLINSVISASVRPNSSGVYAHGQNTLGNGSIRGNVAGGIYNTGGTTALGNTGAGVFARYISQRIRAKG